jgi:hypothetical protein
MRFVTNQFSAETLVDFLLPPAWWYLIAALVHEEAIPGAKRKAPSKQTLTAGAASKE